MTNSCARVDHYGNGPTNNPRNIHVQHQGIASEQNIQNGGKGINSYAEGLYGGKPTMLTNDDKYRFEGGFGGGGHGGRITPKPTISTYYGGGGGYTGGHGGKSFGGGAGSYCSADHPEMQLGHHGTGKCEIVFISESRKNVFDLKRAKVQKSIILLFVMLLFIFVLHYTCAMSAIIDSVIYIVPYHSGSVSVPSSKMTVLSQFQHPDTELKTEPLATVFSFSEPSYRVLSKTLGGTILYYGLQTTYYIFIMFKKLLLLFIFMAIIGFFLGWKSGWK